MEVLHDPKDAPGSVTLEVTLLEKAGAPAHNLGLAMLIAEDEAGAYEPVAVVSTVSEAIELVTSDLTQRRRDLEGGASPLCPYQYTLWHRDRHGTYRAQYRINI
jgi:hypothetical protein